MFWKHRVAVGFSMFFISLLTVGIVVYIYFIHHRIYIESSDHLLTTYNQVSRTFNLFADRNHYFLHDWDDNIQLTADSQDGTLWKTYAERQDNWGYTNLYLLNEDDEFLSIDGEEGVNENLNVIFDDAYRQNHYVVRSFMSTMQKRLVVFAEALTKPYVIDGTEYTCMAVAYDNDVLVEMLAGNIYSDQSDCYVINTDGDVILSLQKKTVFPQHIDNLFDFFKDVSRPEQGTWENFRKGVANGASDSIAIRYNGHSYYVVYMPVGIDDWTITGIVNEDAVDSGMRDVQKYTMFILIAVTMVAWVSIVGTIVVFYNKRLQLKEQERDISENLANTDGLTGLFNERYFSKVLHIKEEKKVPFVLYYIDLDRFKPVNDTYGHDTGDKLLKAVAERLLSCIRSNDYAFRIGGDEFSLVVSAEFSDLQCSNMKQRIETALSRTYVIDEIVLKVGASVGYAAYPFDCDNASDVRIRADRNMYEDKLKHHEAEQ